MEVCAFLEFIFVTLQPSNSSTTLALVKPYPSRLMHAPLCIPTAVSQPQTRVQLSETSSG